jgi:hypothetical protein
VGKANPLPDINPNITIENPQNATYHVNTITLNFTIESNWGVYPCFYSLDGQKMEPIENLTVISREDVNIGKNPQVHRTTLKGSFVIDSSESLLTALVVDASGASVAILGIGLLVYFKKRKKGSGNKA